VSDQYLLSVARGKLIGRRTQSYHSLRECKHNQGVNLTELTSRVHPLTATSASINVHYAWNVATNSVRTNVTSVNGGLFDPLVNSWYRKLLRMTDDPSRQPRDPPRWKEQPMPRIAAPRICASVVINVQVTAPSITSTLDVRNDVCGAASMARVKKGVLQLALLVSISSLLLVGVQRLMSLGSKACSWKCIHKDCSLPCSIVSSNQISSLILAVRTSAMQHALSR
jgi:hypothetical protein